MQSALELDPTADLQSPSPRNGLLPPGFEYWYTLGLFRRNDSPIKVELTDYVPKVAFFAQVLGGGQYSKGDAFGRLVVAASDWGYHRNWANEDVLRLAENIILQGKLESQRKATLSRKGGTYKDKRGREQLSEQICTTIEGPGVWKREHVLIVQSLSYEYSCYKATKRSLA